MPATRAVHPRRAFGAALVAVVATVSLLGCGSSKPTASAGVEMDPVTTTANATDQPVVISATLLTESSQGLSVAVTTTTTAAP